MTNDQLREAVKIQQHRQKRDAMPKHEYEALEILISLAESVLAGRLVEPATEDEILKYISQYIPLGNYKYRKALAHALVNHIAKPDVNADLLGALKKIETIIGGLKANPNEFVRLVDSLSVTQQAISKYEGSLKK